MTTAPKDNVTVVVLTLNEERNLAACLSSVAGLATQIFVVDSGSTDHTPEIARRHSAEIVSHPFETHSAQWAWALRSLPISTDWILGLDADQRLTTEARDELDGLLDGDRLRGVSGVYISRRQVFRGRWIRHGAYYPKYLLKLFRKADVVVDAGDLVDHHFSVRGQTKKLRSDLIEENRNEDSIAFWSEKHIEYAARQAEEEARRRLAGSRMVPGRFFGSPDERTRWLKALWSRLPLRVRPVLYFLYRYVVRLGFLDGKEGFLFHFLQGFWYRLLVDVQIEERLRKGSSEPRAVTDPAAANPIADVRPAR